MGLPDRVGGFAAHFSLEKFWVHTFLGSYADDVLEVLQEAQEELKDEFKIIIE